MNITSAQYKVDLDGVTKTVIKATIDGTVWSVPIDINNSDYAEIKRQVDAGELTIEDAD